MKTEAAKFSVPIHLYFGALYHKIPLESREPYNFVKNAGPLTGGIPIEGGRRADHVQVPLIRFIIAAAAVLPLQQDRGILFVPYDIAGAKECPEFFPAATSKGTPS